MLEKTLLRLTAIYAYFCGSRNKKSNLPLECQVLEMKNGQVTIMPRYHRQECSDIKIFSTDLLLDEDITSFEQLSEIRHKEIPLIFSNNGEFISMAPFRPKDYNLHNAYAFVILNDRTTRFFRFEENEWVSLDFLQIKSEKDNSVVAESCD